jgi:hypothetical protein
MGRLCGLSFALIDLRNGDINAGARRSPALGTNDEQDAVSTGA